MLTQYTASRFLDHLCGGTPFAQPAGRYLKLHIGPPGVNCLSRMSAVATRSAVTFGPPIVASTVAVAVTNTPSWLMTTTEILTHVSLWDAPTSGNPLSVFEIQSPKTVYNGDTYTISPGSLLYFLAESISA